MYKFAYKFDDEIVFYFDECENKYVVSGGNLSWRINNPGLVQSHSHFSQKYGSIGSYERYAIFSDPQEGRMALTNWLHSKKYYNFTLKTIAKHYQPNTPDKFLSKLSSLTNISPDIKVKNLTKQEFDCLTKAIEKLCSYVAIGNESFSLLPKITAKIENGKTKEDTYLIGDGIVLTKKEAMEWIQSHRLDGIIVHEHNGSIHLRSRPNHCICNIKTHESVLHPSEEKIDTLVRIVGVAKPNQCIWAFINGIDNNKDEALKSAERISKAAGGERVLSMPNDSLGLLIDFFTCCMLKVSIDTPIIAWSIKFLRYLLTLEKASSNSSLVVVFVHSQGAIIVEHALELLNPCERERLRIFTFGGGSFIASGKSHPDSHNYASAADFVCRFGSPKLQLLALERYFGHKKGLSDQQVIDHLALKDAMLDLDSTNSKMMEAYEKQRAKYYETEFLKINNLTILDPDPGSNWKHTFSSDCYQKIIRSLVKKYQNY